MLLKKNSQFAPNPSWMEVVYLISAQTDGGGVAWERPLDLEEKDVCGVRYPVKGASLGWKGPSVSLLKAPGKASGPETPVSVSPAPQPASHKAREGCRAKNKWWDG